MADDTTGVFEHLREHLAALTSDPLIPRLWRQRAVELIELLPPEPHLDPRTASPEARASDLIAAARLYRDLWAVFCRFEAAVVGARAEPEHADWRADAVELVDQFNRGAAQ